MRLCLYILLMFVFFVSWTYPNHDLLLHVIHDGVPVLGMLRRIFRDQILGSTKQELEWILEELEWKLISLRNHKRRPSDIPSKAGKVHWTAVGQQKEQWFIAHFDSWCHLRRCDYLASRHSIWVHICAMEYRQLVTWPVLMPTCLELAPF